MSHFKRFTLLAAALTALASPAAFAGDSGQPDAAAAASARAVTGGTCAAMNVIDHREDSGTNASTSSSAFSNVPNTAVSFTQGTAGCAQVIFAAESFAPGGGRLMGLRVVLDGATVASPGPVLFSGDDDENNNGHWARSRSFMFSFSNVAAGAHTITVQYRSYTAGSPVFIGRHSVAVWHP